MVVCSACASIAILFWTRYPPPLPNLNLRFGFEPFGDPYERKRHVQEKRKREAPMPPNAEGIPRGTYTSTCNGCAVNEEKRLLVCTHCLDQRMNRVDAEIALDVCGDGEIIGNHNGILNCEPDPVAVAQAEQAAAEAAAEEARDDAEAAAAAAAAAGGAADDDGGDGGDGNANAKDEL